MTDTRLAPDPRVLFGQRLRARRLHIGYTLADVSRISLVSVPYISNIELGRGNPTLDVISRLAIALNMSPSLLLRERI